MQENYVSLANTQNCSPSEVWRAAVRAVMVTAEGGEAMKQGIDKIAVPDGFQIGRVKGLTWNSVCGYAAEVTKRNGDVYYRGEFVCTVWNDEDGGDQVNANGRRMSDDAVLRAVRAIDKKLAKETVTMSDVVKMRKGADWWISDEARKSYPNDSAESFTDLRTKCLRVASAVEAALANGDTERASREAANWPDEAGPWK